MREYCDYWFILMYLLIVLECQFDFITVLNYFKHAYNVILNTVLFAWADVTRGSTMALIWILSFLG